MEALNNYGEQHYNGEAVVKFLTDYADWSIYISALYLAFVFWGPYYIEKMFKGKQPVGLIKKMWGLWNVGLSVFSLYGSIIIAPTLIHNFQTMGTKKALCEFRAEEVVSGKVGFAMGMFAISKIFEFGDTFFLLMAGSKNLRFMSWFHHITIFLYSWYAYQQKSTIFIIIASMNYPVHTIMYFYFAMSEFGFAWVVKPFAKYITIMQICQMIGGITMTAIAQYHKWQEDKFDACPGATWAMCRGQHMIYICNLYLFTEMFLKAYVWKKAEPKKDRKAH